jgi:Transposase DDE domain
VDALVRDAYRAHYALGGERLDPRTAEAARLLATVTGQDIEKTPDGRFRIFAGSAPDRVISTVDPEAGHGHKTAAHGFDGSKAHVAADPDSQVICAAEVSPATTGDAVVAPTLLDDLARAKATRPPRQWATATMPLAPAPIWPGWTSKGSRRWSRPRSRPHPAAASPRSSSASTFRLAR